MFTSMPYLFHSGEGSRVGAPPSGTTAVGPGTTYLRLREIWFLHQILGLFVVPLGLVRRSVIPRYYEVRVAEGILPFEFVLGGNRFF